MRIDRKTLNLVVPCDTDDGKELYIHVQPLSEEAYDQNYRILARTYNGLYAEGLGIGGPRVAMKVLKGIAERDKNWPEVESGLVAEMHRGASVLAQNTHGTYETFLWDDAVQREIISHADAREVDNAIVFFIVSSCLNSRKEMEGVFEALSGILDARQTSSTPSEFANSLRTPTKDVHIGAKPAHVPLSSIPH